MGFANHTVTVSFINLITSLLSLRDDTMDEYQNAQDENRQYANSSVGFLYSDHLERSATAPYVVFQPRDETPDMFRRDFETLAKMLRPVYLPSDAPLAQQVFGGQMQRQRLSVEHILNLINERTVLHRRILDDIAHSHMDVQGQLYGARLHAKTDDHARELRVERLLFQLDEQRRREEVDFWKDTSELREKLFETAGEYQALRHRTSVLDTLEPREDVYA